MNTALDKYVRREFWNVPRFDNSIQPSKKGIVIHILISRSQLRFHNNDYINMYIMVLFIFKWRNMWHFIGKLKNVIDSV